MMKKFIVTLLLICVLLLAGCNGEQSPTETDDVDDMDEEVEDVEDASDEGVADKEDESDEEESSDSDGEAVLGDGKDTLEDFFSKRAVLEFSVTYDMVMPGVATGSMTQYFKDETHMRVDSNVLDIESQTFIVGDSITACTNFGSWSCTAVGEFYVASDGAQDDIQENIDAYNIDQISSKTIAGISATCFEITGDDFEYEMCFSPEGVPVYVRSPTAQGDVTLTASSYSLSVSDSVFDLPAEPTELGGGLIGSDGEIDTCGFCDQLSGDMKDQCIANC